MTRKILILNGPGLADLGSAGGNTIQGLTLERIESECSDLCQSIAIEAEFRQTDDQDELCRWLAKDSKEFDGVIINPLAYSQADPASLQAYRAALKALSLLRKPVVEVHINNIFAPSEESSQPIHEPVDNMGLVCGLGVESYLLGIRSIAQRFESAGAQ